MLLPVLLPVVRRVSAAAVVASVAAVVVTAGALGPHWAVMNDALLKLTPDLAVLLAIGVLAAGIVRASDPTGTDRGRCSRSSRRFR